VASVNQAPSRNQFLTKSRRYASVSTQTNDEIASDAEEPPAIRYADAMCQTDTADTKASSVKPSRKPTMRSQAPKPAKTHSKQASPRRRECPDQNTQTEVSEKRIEHLQPILIQGQQPFQLVQPASLLHAYSLMAAAPKVVPFRPFQATMPLRSPYKPADGRGMAKPTEPQKEMQAPLREAPPPPADEQVCKTPNEIDQSLYSE
jgi:hypothetical protein